MKLNSLLIAVALLTDEQKTAVAGIKADLEKTLKAYEGKLTEVIHLQTELEKSAAKVAKLEEEANRGSENAVQKLLIAERIHATLQRRADGAEEIRVEADEQLRLAIIEIRDRLTGSLGSWADDVKASLVEAFKPFSEHPTNWAGESLQMRRVSWFLRADWATNPEGAARGLVVLGELLADKVDFLFS